MENGGNGKSLLLKVMEEIMGQQLLTHADILRINDRFELSKACKGIANVTDEMGITTIKETGKLKSIISGSSIQIERKNHEPFNWIPKSQFVIACNDIPRIQDTSGGMIRRLAFIHFKLQLLPKDIDYDLLKKLLGTSIKLPADEKNDNALRYIMTKAIFAYREAYKREHLTETDEHKRLLELFTEENQSEAKALYNILLEREGGIDGFLNWINGKPLSHIFEELATFLGYNSTNEIKHITQKAFLIAFNKLLPTNVQRKNKTEKGRTIKVYVVR